jgi:hypothetical protein
MTKKKIQLTYKELQDITYDDLEGFELLYNAIPNDGGNPNDYMEDDGRQFRICEFKDLSTGETYYFNYTWHHEWDHQFPDSLLSDPDEIEGIEFVEKSVRVKEEALKPEPVVVLTPEQQADKDLVAKYNALKDSFVKMNSEKEKQIPKAKIKEINDYLKRKDCTMIGVRALAYPLCIQHQVTEDSLWHYIQVVGKRWKGSKFKI